MWESGNRNNLKLPFSNLWLQFSVLRQQLLSSLHVHFKTAFSSLWSFQNVLQFNSLLSHVWLFATPSTAACQASLSPTPRVYSNSCSLSRWCHPTILFSVVPFSSCLQSFPASGFLQMSQFFPSGGQSIGVSASNISPSNEHSGLISFRMDWLDFFAAQRTLKSLLQHHSSKAPIFWRSAFFIVQLSHPHMTTGKTIALTRWTFVGKVMSLLFNMLSNLFFYLSSKFGKFSFMISSTIFLPHFLLFFF